MTNDAPILGPTEAVLFDLDGTLADTILDIAGALNHVLEGRGFPTHDIAAYKRKIGEGVSVLVERALPSDEEHRDLVPAVVEEFRRYYSQHLIVRTRPYAGVPELLTELVARQLPMAVVSNKPHAMSKQIVEHLFEAWPFGFVAGQREGVRSKPDPAAALEAADALSAAPGRCLFLGDTKTDMQTARAAGMVAVGAEWGFRGAEELLTHGAHATIREPMELIGLIDEPPTAGC